jgi:LPS sulfotransferase NodH
MTKPSLNYVICTAPRTGSTLLAEALTGTNVAGRPSEYFDVQDYNEKYWIRRLGIQSNDEYFDRVVAAGTTANGVFGVKLLWHQSPVLVAKLKASLGEAASSAANGSLHGLLGEKLGEPRYIWLRRTNKLAQAISYYRASRTGLWRSVDTRTGMREIADQELPFDFAAISQFLRMVNHFDARWEEYFREHRVKVLMMVYEHFVEHYELGVHSVLDFLGVERAGVTVKVPRLQRQADDRSLDWEQRFLELHKSGASEAEAKPAADAAVVADTASEENASTPKTRTARPKRPAPQPPEQPLPLIAYALSPQPPAIVTASSNRDWMDATPKRFAYRCLPMVMANQAGWLVLNRHKLVVIWNGGIEQDDLKIEYLGPSQSRNVVSIFGSGILTFLIGHLFRTPPGYNLYVHGPANWPKDGICALEGIVESDWAESTFTMNWKLTRPNHPVLFDEGEPIAMVTPMARHQLERFEPEVRNISEDPELEALHREWLASRQRHNAELRIPNSKAAKEGWQRHYMRGTSIRSEPAPEHQTSLTLKNFVDKRS